VDTAANFGIVDLPQKDVEKHDVLESNAQGIAKGHLIFNAKQYGRLHSTIISVCEDTTQKEIHRINLCTYLISVGLAMEVALGATCIAAATKSSLNRHSTKRSHRATEPQLRKR